MHSFNIVFYYTGNPHIASIQYNSFQNAYTIYFTDVELILEFGNKAELLQNGELLLQKVKSSKEQNFLKEAILEQLNKTALVA
jgi:hypothetical protein